MQRNVLMLVFFTPLAAQFALLTTLTYRLDSASEGGSSAGASGSASHERSIEFWTSVRLGKVVAVATTAPTTR